MQNAQGFYNQANALAKLGQYENAVKAYDRALALNPNNKDAQYNRKLIAELLRKQQSNKQQDKNQQNQQDQQQQGGQQDKDQKTRTNRVIRKKKIKTISKNKVISKIKISKI